MERVDYQSLVIQDVINLEKQGELNLNPWYQKCKSHTEGRLV